MPMEVSVRRSPPTDGWKYATVSDPQEFMIAAFKLAELARDASNIEMSEDRWDRAVHDIMTTAVELAHAVYGDFYTPKGDV